jgi:hypothetical protein
VEAGKPGSGSGIGGGGAVRAIPAGVLELTPAGTRFVSLGLERKLLAVGLMGLSLGFILGRRSRNGRPTARRLLGLLR